MFPNKGHSENSTTEWKNLTFYIKHHCFRRPPLLSIEGCCTGELTVVVLRCRSERQDGQHLPRARFNVFVDLRDVIFLALTPCECRWMGGAGVSDRAGDREWMIFSGCLWVSQNGFWRISYNRRKKKGRDLVRGNHCGIELALIYDFLESWWRTESFQLDTIISKVEAPSLGSYFNPEAERPSVVLFDLSDF